MLDDGRPQRLDSLTSLRFFAAAVVVVHHVSGADGLLLADICFVGVTFFFVLSGFVLTWAASTGHGARAFYRNRFARIYPLHLLMLVVAFAVPLTVLNGWVPLVENLSLTQAWDPNAVQSYNAVTWTISAEAFFYLLFPLVVKWLAMCSTRVLCVVALLCWWLQPLAAVVVAMVTNSDTARFLTYFVPVFRLPEFIIGICLALAMARRARPSRADGWIVVLVAVVCGGLALVCDLHDIQSPFLYGTLVIPAIVVCIWGAARGDMNGVRSHLAHPVLVRLGTWSFALYMSHLLVLRVICHILGEPQTGLLPVWASIPILVLATAVAAVLHKFWERPFERALRTPTGHERAGVRATADDG